MSTLGESKPRCRQHAWSLGRKTRRQKFVRVSSDARATTIDIRTHSELAHVEFIPLNDVNAFNLGNPLDGIAPEGSIFIQSPEIDPRRVWDHIPAYGQKIIRDRKSVV